MNHQYYHRLFLVLSLLRPIQARLGARELRTSIFDEAKSWMPNFGFLLPKPDQTEFFTISGTDEDIPEQYIVEFDDDLADELIEQRAQEVALQLGGVVKWVYRHAMKGVTIEQTSGGFGDASRMQIPGVKTIEADHTIGASSVHIQSSAPPALDRVNQSRLPLDGKYDYVYDGAGVTVFVLDTGIRATHKEFANVRVTCGFNAYKRDEDCTDTNGHGTHVAASIAGRTYGVAKAVDLVNVKILRSSGGGSVGSMIAGVEYVLGRQLAEPGKSMVLNISAGAKSVKASLDAAVRRASEAGVVVVVAAGNESANACKASPAASEHAITVGASEIGWMFWTRDRRAYYSNHGSCVDLFAMGTKVESASTLDDLSSIKKSGTSMAAPHVAGAAALYLQQDPTASAAQIRERILNDATSSQMIWLFQSQAPNKMLNTSKL